MSRHIPVARPCLPAAAAIAPYLARIDAARIYSNFGPLVRELESRLATRHDLAPANVATAANATLALALALDAAGARPGGYCAMPSWTFFATAHAARQAGLEPYFVDVDPVTWAMTPAHIDALPAAVRTRLSAVLPVLPFGAATDPDAWDAWSARTRVPVVVDAAAAFDALKPGRAPAVVSLHATKPLGAGEGAYVVSSDAAMIARLRTMTGFGLAADRSVVSPGTNAKLTEYAAAVALAGLDVWPATRAAWIARRREWLTALGPAAAAAFPFCGTADFVASTLIVRLEIAAAQAQAALTRAGVDSRRWWNAGCAAEREFARHPRGSLAVTEAIAERSIGVPFFIDLTADEIARAAAALCPFLPAS